MMEKISDAIRIAQKVDRANVGVTFNLCHWLRTDRYDLSATLLQASPLLRMVTVNGADHQGEWKELIQPLDSGNFNVGQVIERLQEIQYSNPIGLQGYGIGGDVEENLRRSMQAWLKRQRW
jgi:sugar phosphate isomerase/epimerase